MIAGARVALAAPRDWLYLEHGIFAAGAGPTPSMPVNQMVYMALPLTPPREWSTPAKSARTARVIMLGGGGLGVVVLLAALGLWFHYGTAVFFETIASGISACF